MGQNIFRFQWISYLLLRSFCISKAINSSSICTLIASKFFGIKCSPNIPSQMRFRFALGLQKSQLYSDYFLVQLRLFQYLILLPAVDLSTMYPDRILTINPFVSLQNEIDLVLQRVTVRNNSFCDALFTQISIDRRYFNFHTWPQTVTLNHLVSFNNLNIQCRAIE